jgi:D-alanyl-D-alanine carboxypeptidase (penicillin-binding protein 5/6)
MTAILVIEICRLNSIDIYAEEMTVSTFEEGIPGTTASIRQGEVYTIEQLLHGLMLPSGNDASVTLAVWGGLQLLSQVS